MPAREFEYERNRYEVFKGTSEEIVSKTPLWRYMTFEKFCWLIEMSKLYHPRLDTFEDPFEGSGTICHRSLDETAPSAARTGRRTRKPESAQ